VRTIDRICPHSRPSRQRQRSTASGGFLPFEEFAPADKVVPKPVIRETVIEPLGSTRFRRLDGLPRYCG
jgi:hypothetical protein